MRVAIVGSRTFPQLNLVEQLLQDLEKGTIIVSGGARGVDTFAAKTARMKGLEVDEKLPDLSKTKVYWQFVLAYYKRNQEIVNNSDMVFAFTEKDKGGTWDTIKRTRKAGKPVKIITPS